MHELLQVDETQSTGILSEILNFAVCLYYFRLIKKQPREEELKGDLRKFMATKLVEPRRHAAENLPKQYHQLATVNKFFNSPLFELGHLIVTAYCQSADNERQFSAYKQIQSTSRSNMSDAGIRR